MFGCGWLAVGLFSWTYRRMFVSAAHQKLHWGRGLSRCARCSVRGPRVALPRLTTTGGCCICAPTLPYPAVPVPNRPVKQPWRSSPSCTKQQSSWCGPCLQPSGWTRQLSRRGSCCSRTSRTGRRTRCALGPRRAAHVYTHTAVWLLEAASLSCVCLGRVCLVKVPVWPTCTTQASYAAQLSVHPLVVCCACCPPPPPHPPLLLVSSLCRPPPLLPHSFAVLCPPVLSRSCMLRLRRHRRWPSARTITRY